MLDICATSLSGLHTGSLHTYLCIRFAVVAALLFGQQTARVGAHSGGLGEGVERATEIEFSEKLISKL